jgi:uncharacterized protein involved in exopolysaccharide biosynthesis
MSESMGTRQDDVTVFQLLTPLVRRWKLLIALPLAAGIAAAGISLAVPPVFTANTSFTPEATANRTALSGFGDLLGLAGQLGLAGAAIPTTPEFFSSVIESRQIVEGVLLSTFLGPDGGGHDTLLDLMDVRGRTHAERLSNGVKRLRRLVSVSIDGRTGIVSVSVRQRDPNLAAAVANRFTALLNDFNLERRQSQSRAQARFSAQRLVEAEQELRRAETELRTFLEANRQFRGSPLLDFEHSRLERVVLLKQEVYTTLAKSLEEARIAEVRDTPVLTVIDAAVPPQRRTAPHRKLYVLVALMLGAAVAAALAYVLDLRERAALEARDDFRELAVAVSNTNKEIRGLLRRQP